MKLLLIADEESPFLWDYYKPGILDEYDAIISCGDLNPDYLSFLVTMGRVPVYYVHGNHDGKYAQRPPEGCECIEDTIVKIGGMRVMGLGGCLRYAPGPHQYTEREMRKRIRRMRWQLFINRGVDIVVTHAPVRGIGDEEHISHRGFVAFQHLLKKYNPRYWFFGHVHTSYGGSQKSRVFHSGETVLINACDRFVLEFDEKAPRT